MRRSIRRQATIIAACWALWHAACGYCAAPPTGESASEVATASATRSGALFGEAMSLDEPVVPRFETEASFGALATRLLWGTVVVLGAMVVTLLLAQKYLRRSWSTRDSGPLAIEATLPLANRSCVHVIRVDGHRLAVGCDATGIRSLVLLPTSFDNVLSGVSDRELSAAGSATMDHAWDEREWSPRRQRPEDWELTQWKPQRPTM